MDRKRFLAGPVSSLLRSWTLSLSDSASSMGDPEGDLSVEVTVISSDPPENLRDSEYPLELTGDDSKLVSSAVSFLRHSGPRSPPSPCEGFLAGHERSSGWICSSTMMGVTRGGGTLGHNPHMNTESCPVAAWSWFSLVLDVWHPTVSRPLHPILAHQDPQCDAETCRREE